MGMHWNSDGRKSPGDLPDILLPVDQYELLKVNEMANKIYTAARRPTDNKYNHTKTLSAAMQWKLEAGFLDFK